MSFLTHLSILFLILHLNHHPTYAQIPAQNGEPPPGLTRAPGHHFSVSDASPVAQILNRSPQAIQAIQALSDTFAAIERDVIRSHEEFHGNDTRLRAVEGRREGEALPACHNIGARWRKATNRYMGSRGWPVIRSRSCVTDVFASNTIENEGPSRESVIMDAFERFANVMKDNTGNILDRIVPTLVEKEFWQNRDEKKRPEFATNFPYERGSLQCEVNTLSAFRILGSWHILAELTNMPSVNWLPVFSRRYIREYLRLNDEGTGLVSAQMIAPLDPLLEVPEPVDNSTTLVISSAGADLPSQFLPINFPKHFTVREALAAGERQIQQVEDAITASNIAIIALPLAMNLIPVALVADVSRTTAVFLAVLSDVLTSLPMAIKGVELLAISGNRFLSVATRVGDVRSENGSVAAEMWMVSCGTYDQVRPIGIAFLVVSISFMFLGIALEFLCRWYVNRNRRRKLLLELAADKSYKSLEGAKGSERQKTSNDYVLYMDGLDVTLKDPEATVSTDEDDTETAESSFDSERRVTTTVLLPTTSNNANQIQRRPSFADTAMSIRRKRKRTEED